MSNFKAGNDIMILNTLENNNYLLKSFTKISSNNNLYLYLRLLKLLEDDTLCPIFYGFWEINDFKEEVYKVDQIKQKYYTANLNNKITTLYFYYNQEKHEILSNTGDSLNEFYLYKNIELEEIDYKNCIRDSSNGNISFNQRTELDDSIKRRILKYQKVDNITLAIFLKEICNNKQINFTPNNKLCVIEKKINNKFKSVYVGKLNKNQSYHGKSSLFDYIGEVRYKIYNGTFFKGFKLCGYEYNKFGKIIYKGTYKKNKYYNGCQYVYHIDNDNNFNFKNYYKLPLEMCKIFNFDPNVELKKVEIVRVVCKYIKENKLRENSDYNIIKLDHNLAKLFNLNLDDKINSYELHTIISKIFIPKMFLEKKISYLYGLKVDTKKYDSINRILFNGLIINNKYYLGKEYIYSKQGDKICFQYINGNRNNLIIEKDSIIKSSLTLNKNIKKNLECSICHNLLNDPLRTKCGHIFCQICIFKWLERHDNCPICRVENIQNSLKNDFTIKRIVDIVS
jgi:hypothetical protein